MSAKSAESKQQDITETQPENQKDNHNKSNLYLVKTPDDPDVQAPEDYEFIKTIGDGSFGKVKLGVHKLTGEHVAIKILFKERIKEKTDIERISRQIKIMKAIRHPFVVQTYQIIEAPKCLFLVMEYVQGGDLFDTISSSSKLSETLAKQYFSQIVLGLEYLHSVGITHRDMKPQNILIADYGKIKIADFGLGNFFSESQTLKTACGSPCYAPPEMLNQQEYDPRKVDIWSSGVILYAMVHGYLPFEDDVQALLYQKIKTKNIRVASSVTIPCRNLLRGLLIKDQRQRWTIDIIKQHEFLSEEISKQQQYVELEQAQINNTEEFKQICQQLGIRQQDHNRLLNSIKKNKHNNLTTLYYLGRKKILREIVESKDSVISGNLEEKIIKQEPDAPSFETRELNPLSLSDRKPFSFFDKPEINHLADEKQKVQKNNIEKTEKQNKIDIIQQSSNQLASQTQTQSIEQSSSTIGHYDAQTPSSPNEVPIPREPPKQFTIQPFQVHKIDSNQSEEKKDKSIDLQLPSKIVKNNNNKPFQTSPINKNLKKDIQIPKKNQKQDKLKIQPKGNLKKSERMPIYKPKQQTHKTNDIQTKLYQRSHSKDRPIVLKNTLKYQKNSISHKTKKQENVSVTSKQIHIEPHLINIELLVISSIQKLCEYISKKGYSGKIQYYSYDKQSLLVVKSQLKAVKPGSKLDSIERIIQEINQLSTTS